MRSAALQQFIQLGANVFRRVGHERAFSGEISAHDTLPPQAEMETLLHEAGFAASAVRDEPGRYVAVGRKAP